MTHPTDPGVDDAPARARIFISYSRNDRAFADRLDAILRASGFATLIDRSDIYAFEDWWKRIESMIVGADTIVFIVSPDSVASEICKKEVAFANGLGKRFAPVLWRAIAIDAAPIELTRLNFLDFSTPENEAENAARLVEALDADIDWIRKHTQFGEAALRWSRAGRPGPKGLLLRPPLLEEAERWIAARPDAAPAPPDDLLAFISESRRAETQRRNRLTSGIVAGLIVASALSGNAYWQKKLGDQQRKLAETNAEEAAAQERLAQTRLVESQKSLVASRLAEARRFAGRDDHRSALDMALASAELEKGYSNDAPDSTALLRDLIKKNKLVLALKRPTSNGPWPFAFLDDSRLAYVTPENLFVIDIETRSVLWRHDLPGVEHPVAIALADRDTIWIADRRKAVIVSRPMREIAKSIDFDEDVKSLAVARRLGAVATDKGVYIVTPSSPAPKKLALSLDPDPLWTRAMTFSSDREKLYVYERAFETRAESIRGIAVSSGKTAKFSLPRSEDRKPHIDSVRVSLLPDLNDPHAFLYVSTNDFGRFHETDKKIVSIGDALAARFSNYGSALQSPLGMQYDGFDPSSDNAPLVVTRNQPADAEAMVVTMNALTEANELSKRYSVSFVARDAEPARFEECKAAEDTRYLACYYSTVENDGILVFDRDYIPRVLKTSQEVLAEAKAVLRAWAQGENPDAPFER